jgi:putative transposase
LFHGDFADGIMVSYYSPSKPPVQFSGSTIARTQRQPPAGLVFHSDRGVQYASHDYRQALQNSQAIASMSRKGNCYDNAAMESFWSTLKHELIYRRHFKTRDQARQAIFEFIEVFHCRPIAIDPATFKGGFS